MYNHHSKNGTNTADIPERNVGDCLLEVGDWKLLKARFPLTTGVGSYPVHMCGKSPEGYGVHRVDGLPEQARRRMDGRCIKCDEKMPDEIRGLWTLHNWDVVVK